MSPELTAEQSIRLGFSFNKRLWNNLQYLRNATLHQDYDAGILVDGGEGTGKSVFGQQVAAALDRDHRIDLDLQMCFTPAQFKKAVLTLGKGKAIIWDEARRGLNRRRFGSDVNLSITDMLAECRSRNLFLVIIMPSFYDMDMNVAVWRTRALIHVWAEMNPSNPERPLKRGMFRFYNERGKKLLYTNKLWRQQYKYPFIPNECFDATFVHHYVVDEAEYRKRKAEAQQDYAKEAEAPKPISDKDRNTVRGELIGFLRRNRWLKQGGIQAIAKHYGVSDRTLYNWEKGEFEGSGEMEDGLRTKPGTGQASTYGNEETEEGDD